MFGIDPITGRISTKITADLGPNSPHLSQEILVIRAYNTRKYYRQNIQDASATVVVNFVVRTELNCFPCSIFWKFVKLTDMYLSIFSLSQIYVIVYLHGYCWVLLSLFNTSLLSILFGYVCTEGMQNCVSLIIFSHKDKAKVLCMCDRKTPNFNSLIEFHC